MEEEACGAGRWYVSSADLDYVKCAQFSLLERQFCSRQRGYFQQLTDLNAQKIQLEIDFNYLRDIFANKKRIKLEPSGLDPFGEFEEGIRQKKHRLSDVNQKLTAVLKEDTLLSSRIRGNRDGEERGRTETDSNAS